MRRRCVENRQRSNIDFAKLWSSHSHTKGKKAKFKGLPSGMYLGMPVPWAVADHYFSMMSKGRRDALKSKGGISAADADGEEGAGRAAAQGRVLSPGTTVLVEGLQKAPLLNGCAAVVEARSREPRRGTHTRGRHSHDP